jgi:hypothetical protein
MAQLKEDEWPDDGEPTTTELEAAGDPVASSPAEPGLYVAGGTQATPDHRGAEIAAPVCPTCGRLMEPGFRKSAPSEPTVARAFDMDDRRAQLPAWLCLRCGVARARFG